MRAPTILVTGSTRGIGAAIAETLHQAGVTVIGHGSRARAAPDTSSQAVIAADLTDPLAPAKLWQEALARSPDGRIDVLINNAGLFASNPIKASDIGWLDAWEDTLRINLTAAAQLSRLAVEHWQASGTGGRIVHIASRAGHRGDSPDHWHYAAAKGGMLALHKTIARGYAAQGIEPIREGPFHVHTPDFPALGQPGVRDLLIPASRAFGTGQHATTAGCLAMLTAMKARGVTARNIADIGTGTGLLAFAALHLWPRGLATASDIDEVCAPVVIENAALNHIPLGAGSGAVTMVIAAGLDHPLLEARGPYDLLIANILAGPLVELASDFGAAVAPGGSLLLAGLLTTQERAVRRACTRAGFRLAARIVRGDWSILWLRKRRSYA